MAARPLVRLLGLHTAPCISEEKGRKMPSWLRRRRETAERIDAEADALIGDLGVEVYAEARRRE